MVAPAGASILVWKSEADFLAGAAPIISDYPYPIKDPDNVDIFYPFSQDFVVPDGAYVMVQNYVPPEDARTNVILHYSSEPFTTRLAPWELSPGGAAQGDYLRFNGSEWTPRPEPVIRISHVFQGAPFSAPEVYAQPRDWGTQLDFMFAAQIYSASVDANNHLIFTFTDNSTRDMGALQVSGTGEAGRGIDSIVVNSNNHLIITYTDGGTQDAGALPAGISQTGSATSLAWTQEDWS